MRIWLLGLVAGLAALALPFVPALGSTAHIGIVGAGCVPLLVRRWLVVSGLLLGFAWGSHSNHVLLEARLPSCVLDSVQQFSVEILGDPESFAGRSNDAASVRFRGLVVAGGGKSGREPGLPACGPVPGTQLRLTWYGPPRLGRGEIWRLQSRLKPPWGYQNPGGFDFERWLLSERLQGTGYVLQGTLTKPAPASAISRFRELLRKELGAGHLNAGGILYALVSGDGSALSSEQWQRFRATGTIHLMVVSGLHVGLVAGMGFLFGGWLSRLVPALLLWLPARRVGALTGLLLAGCFVQFTGNGVPGVRALCMSAVAFFAVLCGRRVRSVDALLLALALVLGLDPVAVHQQGFWLSFCAVGALLLFFVGRYQRVSPWKSLLWTQLVLFVALTPLLAALHGQVPIVGVLANLLVVPVMSVLVIPLTLASAAMLVAAPELAGFGFYLADHALRLLLELLEQLAAFPSLIVAPLPWHVAMALGGAILLVLVLVQVGRWRDGLALCLLWLCWSLPRDSGLPNGEFRVMALDVGQGSSIIVDTSEHRLLFDAGPRYPSGFDLGAAVVVPSFGATGVQRLDVMVLSHSDLDHRGGADSVLDSIPVARVYESVPSPGSKRCRKGISWVWDGVRFRFLSPPGTSPAANDNDGSCVLEVYNARERVLLPGDISTNVEQTLVHAAQPVRLLFAPHHGSNTSSSSAFVRILHPDVVFVSAGKRNRYNHPHRAVVRRYQAIDATLFVTGETGALVWESRWPREVDRYRLDEGAYWVTGR